MEINDIPIEMLEAIFKKLDFTSLAQSRLVCHTWNDEILSHGELGLIINNRRQGNLSFVQQVNNPVSLTIRTPKYNQLRPHSLAKVVRLTFLFWSRLSAILNVKFFSDHCPLLTRLTLHEPVLSSCDMQAKCGTCIPAASLFPNLLHLCMYQIEDYKSKLFGSWIQLTSKNITFLLQSIASVQLKTLAIQLNDSFYDVNCCRARLEYRFEAFTLPEFINRQPHLDQLDLGIPPSMPGKIWDPKCSTPTKLKHLSIEHKTGYQYIIWTTNFIQIPRLLEWELGFYDNMDEPVQSLYWKGLLLAQTKLETVYLINHGHFGGTDFLDKLIKNNYGTLTCLILETKLCGCIHANWFQVCRLEELHLSNHLFHDLPDQHIDEHCTLVNVGRLPKCLKKLALRNITLDFQGLLELAGSTTLRSVEYIFEIKHYMDLVTLPNFEIVLKRFLRARSLDRFVIGRLNLHELAVQEIQEGWSELSPWFDESDELLSIM